MPKKKTSKSAAKRAVTKKKLVTKKKTAPKKKVAAKKKAVNKPAAGKKQQYSKTDLKKIREGLLKKKAQILEELMSMRGNSLNRSIKDASGDLSSYTFHMADMATDLYDREFSLEIAEGERERLFVLDDAIKRVDEGVYGKCDECGCLISKQRMKVIPQAQYCIKCQEESEKSEGK
jgi:DnaK suppressor protein